MLLGVVWDTNPLPFRFWAVGCAVVVVVVLVEVKRR